MDQKGAEGGSRFDSNEPTPSQPPLQCSAFSFPVKNTCNDKITVNNKTTSNTTDNYARANITTSCPDTHATTQHDTSRHINTTRHDTTHYDHTTSIPPPTHHDHRLNSRARPDDPRRSPVEHLHPLCPSFQPKGLGFFPLLAPGARVTVHGANDPPTRTGIPIPELPCNSPRNAACPGTLDSSLAPDDKGSPTPTWLPTPPSERHQHMDLPFYQRTEQERANMAANGCFESSVTRTSSDTSEGDESRPAGFRSVALVHMRTTNMRHPSHPDQRYIPPDSINPNLGPFGTTGRPQNRPITRQFCCSPTRRTRPDTPIRDPSSERLTDAFRHNGLAAQRTHHQKALSEHHRSPRTSERGTVPSLAHSRNRRRSPDDVGSYDNKRSENLPRWRSPVRHTPKETDNLRNQHNEPDQQIRHRKVDDIIKAIISSKGSFRFRPREPDSNSNIPLKAKHVGKAYWEAVDELVREACTQCPAGSANLTLYELYAWMKKCVLNPGEAGMIPLPQGIEEAQLEEADIAKLLTFGYIHEIFGSIDEIKSTVRVFTVAQDSSGQITRRVIFCPDGVNSVLIDAGFTQSHEANIPNVEEQKTGMFSVPGALTADGTAFYTQFPSAAPGEFIFSWRGRIFRCASICTGQRQCVCLAQIVLTALRIVTLRFFGPSPALQITPFIDNVRFAGAQQLAEQAWQFFRERASRCGLTFELTSEWSPKYVFLGIEYNHETRMATLGPKTIAKLAKYLPLQEAPHWSMLDFVSLFGLLIWANTVLELCPAERYEIFKYIRRRGDRDLKEPADLWPCLYTPIVKWITKLLNTSVPLRLPPTTCDENIYIFSDACPAGYGILIFYRSSIFVSAGHFQKDEDIFVLEARAFLYAVQFLITLIAEGKISRTAFAHFRVDNTSAIGALNRGRSTNFLLNGVVLRLQQQLQLFIPRWDLKYVKSANNFSDPISRCGLSFATEFINE